MFAIGDRLQRSIASLMNEVRVNRISNFERHGIAMISKRRLAGAGFVIVFGNAFLSLANNTSRMFVTIRNWISWELHCTNLLYPERQASAESCGSTIQFHRIPGISLRALAIQNKVNAGAIIAVARELRRVHGIICPNFQSGWSHGDMHFGNILYDSETDTAVLIDFDTFHQHSVDQQQRHVDDLLVFLLELMARLDESWETLATAFIDEYDNNQVLHELTQHLVKPRGIARILWYTRTYNAPECKMSQRISILQEIVQRRVQKVKIPLADCSPLT